MNDEEETEEIEEELEEEKRGRKIKCSCDVDPEWCEKHNDYA